MSGPSTARALRRRQTPGERKLWAALRARRFDGLKFRRQAPVANFVVDFLCPALKLVIEVDGGVHAFRQDEDRARAMDLERHGFFVLRVDSHQVMVDVEGVLGEIWAMSRTIASPEDLTDGTGCRLARHGRRH